MYKRLRVRRLKLRISRKSVVFLTVALITASLVLLVLSGICADPDEINEYVEGSFNECFDEISAEALGNMSGETCPDTAELAGFKNTVLGKLRSKYTGLKIMLIEPEGADIFHLRYPVIKNVDANISGYFKQELKDPDGNIGIYTIKFIASAKNDSDKDFICEAECLVYQTIVKGSAPYLLSDDLFE